MALALGENRDQHVGARHLFAARRLDVDRGALHDTLEPRRRLGFLAGLDDQIFEFGVDVARDVLAQRVEVDVAGAHDRGAPTSTLTRCVRSVARYIDTELENLVVDAGEEAKATAGDIYIARGDPRPVVRWREVDRTSDVLVAILAERESHAAYFLQERDVTH